MAAQVRGGAQETAQCEALHRPVTSRGGERRSGGGDGVEGSTAQTGSTAPNLSVKTGFLTQIRKSRPSTVHQ